MSGGSVTLTDVDWKLVLLSRDILGESMLSKDKNIAQFNIEDPDLFRQFFASYSFVSLGENTIATVLNGDRVYIRDVNDQNHHSVREIQPFPNGRLSYNMIKYFGVNPTLITINNENALVPNIVVPFRIFARDADSKVQGDLHWRTLFMGGEWAGQTLPQLFNRERVYYDASTIIGFPSSEKHERDSEFLGIDGGGSYPSNKLRCSIKSNYNDYNHNVAQYQEWASNLDSELLIPNINVIAKYLELERQLGPGSVTYAFAHGFGGALLRGAMEINQGKWTESESKLFAYHFPAGQYYKDLEKDQYFGTFFPQTTANEQFKDSAMNSQQNIFFNDKYFYHLYYNGGYNKTIVDLLEYKGGASAALKDKLSTFYNVEINFHRHGNMKIDVENYGDPDREHSVASTKVAFEDLQQNDQLANDYRTKQTIRKEIALTGFDSRFLEILKDLDEGRITEVNRKVLPFAYSLTRPGFKNISGVPTETPDRRVEISEQAIGLKSTNFLELLLNTYNNPQDNLNTNYTYASPSMGFDEFIEETSTQRDDNISRTKNNSAMASVINSTIKYLKEYMEQITPGLSVGVDDHPTTDAFEGYNNYISDRAINDLYGPNLHFNEVLAYKIEKIGGTPTGDASEQQVIQKFWVFNSFFAGQEIKILDSQVKYGQNYTYKITAYTLVLSHKYKYGDLRLTKQVGKGDYKAALDADTGGAENEYCLEFYDPFNNNETAGQLYKSVNATGRGARAGIALENNLAPNSIAISRYPQLADFNLYAEPCLELIEIPMFQKTISVMDNPPNACNSQPFHFIDNSNRVGFNISQDSFIKRPYPETISSQDIEVKHSFLRSKALQPYDVINKFSESPARYIEMYRIKSKPNSLSDFNDALVATIDLRIENETYNYSNKVLSDKIKINTKYYYVFRYLNENRIPGPLSQIIECELVNDGGYTYALFDTVDTSDFNPNQNTTKNVLFKKLLQLEPNINQLYLIDDPSGPGVDYNDYASRQVNHLQVGSAPSRIWDKKFKIRLTSKKTGKKIDLNVSYNYLIRDLSKALFTEIPAPIPGGAEQAPSHEILDTGATPTGPFISSISTPEDAELIARTSYYYSYGGRDDSLIVNIGEDWIGY